MVQALPPGEVAPVAPPGGPDVPEPDVLPEEEKPADIAPILRRRKKPQTAPGPALFKVGDRVRARNINPRTHTRLPRYARGRVGVVEAIAGVNPIADAAALGREDPQWHYTVVFTGPELWGDGADQRLSVAIGAAESYLEPA